MGESNDVIDDLIENDSHCKAEVIDKAIWVTNSDELKLKLTEPWSNALIIKVVGAKHAYGFLYTKLQQK